MTQIEIPDTASLGRAAREFLALIPAGRRLIAFDGPMGAGKTTFIAALARELGSRDDSSSPTFSIVNEYEVPGQRDADSRIFHFDFYRVESEAEAMDMGAEEYFDSGSYCFMEWAENVAGILPENTLRVAITPQPDGSRRLTF